MVLVLKVFVQLDDESARVRRACLCRTLCSPNGTRGEAQPLQQLDLGLSLPAKCLRAKATIEHGLAW